MINPQKYSWILVRGNLGSIRWQTTDVPPKEESTSNVSTKVQPIKQSNLMEFFDTSENLYESKIIHGECFGFCGLLMMKVLNRTVVVFG
jgi:hypothetical protein